MLFLGASMKEALECSPRQLWPYEDAFIMREKYDDKIAYYHGFYSMEAFGITLGNAFRKKGTKPMPWLKKPILQEIEDQDKPLTEEEKQRKVDAHFHRLEIMAFNDRLSKM